MLTAISPIDGRYSAQTEDMSNYFSEFAFIRFRFFIEVEYFLFLSDKRFFALSGKQQEVIKSFVNYFNENDAERIKEIEGITNHDVKAIEYYFKERLEEIGLGKLKEWVHFSLTSQDINNPAITFGWKAFMQQEYLPALERILNKIKALTKEWKHVPMLAKTHGQPASPTLLGKEFMVFVERISNQVLLFTQIPYSTKFGGATGNFNAHVIAFPKHNWTKLADEFVEKRLELKRQQFTTQIEHYDHLAAQFDTIQRINTILIDLCRDVWTYISMDYFKQKTKQGEVGSSAMPHKVNPIDFENAEGNLGIANALLQHFSSKLPISRLQRDLTDSTVLRNIGVPVAHTIIAFNAIQKGLNKLVLNEVKINADLENNWAVIAEAIQTILRRENYPNPYEALKELTRGNATIDKKSMHQFIGKLKVSAAIKAELKAITPQNYTGKVAK